MLILCVLMSACTPIVQRPVAIERCPSCPIALASARAAKVGDVVYLIGGRDSVGKYHNELFTYTISTNQWSLGEKMPMRPRVRAAVCAINNDIYIGLGSFGHVSIDSTYLTDWWRYRPADNSWKQLAEYPCDLTVGGVCYSDGEYIYVAYGNHQYFRRDVYRYRISTDSWQKMYDDTPHDGGWPPRAHSCTGAMCNGHYFLGTGYYRNSVDFWAEMLVNDTVIDWKRCASVPGKGRIGATAISNDQDIYLAGGRYFGGTVTDGVVYADIVCYHPGEDRWTHSATLPDGPRENMIAFRDQDYIYFGLGNDKYNVPCRELYRIKP